MASEEEVTVFLSDIPQFNLSSLYVDNTNGSHISIATASNEQDNNVLEEVIGISNNVFSSVEDYLALHRDVPELPNTFNGKIITSLAVFDVMLIFVILLFIAFVDDRKISNEKQPIFIPTRPIRGFRKYAVILETGQSPAGGTTSGVFIRLCGKLAKSPAFSLSWNNEISRQLFWSQNKDTFILSVPHYLGSVDSVELLTDAVGTCPPWFLKSIRVMCLDNQKCWKSRVNTWLRGDRKPFSFRTSIIGALSTRDYVKKVFLQNHSWITIGTRKLGSTFTCVQRCSVLWFSISAGMFLANYLMYKWPYGEDEQIDTNTGLRIPIALILRGDDAVSAGVLGALGGAFVGILLRGLIKLMTSSYGWSRVDDKDDFTHLMNPNRLAFTLGAVVIAQKVKYSGPKIPPFPPCVDDDIIKLLDSLSPKQIETVRMFVNSKEYELEGSTETPSSNSNRRTKLTEVVQQTMKASEREYGKTLTVDKNSAWGKARQGIRTWKENEKSMQSSAGKKDMEMSNSKESIEDIQEETKSAKGCSFANEINQQPEKRLSNSAPQVPQVSARYSNITMPSTAESMEAYDSLSECESEAESMTKALKTSAEINLRRREQKVYDSAPWWDDRHKVYVSAPDVGDEHYKAVNERYDRTAPAAETGCCRVRKESAFGEDAILNYLEDEDGLPLGGVVGTNNIAAILISSIAFLAAVGTPPYVVYERLPLPDAHALYYLYAVILCLVFHGVIFCTADAVACALFATMARRRRVAKAQEKNNTSFL